MTSSAALWRRLDVPGHDACRLDELEDGWRLHGAAVFRLDGAPARLDYFVDCDRAWRARTASVEGWVGAQEIAITIAHGADGRWLLDDVPVPGLDDCIDVDFGFTPATNVLQLRRVALAVGEAASVPVAWLDVPSNTLERLEQRYRRLTDATYDYASHWPTEVQIPRLAPLARDDREAAPLARDDREAAPLARDDREAAPLARDDKGAAALARDDYHGVLETTAEGFVRRYPGLWELEGS